LAKVLAIALAGSLGAVTRYGIGVWFGERFGPGFPWATFVINITGAFILGVLTALGRDRLGPVLFPALTTGFLGAYTTFSTWMVDSILLLDRGAVPAAVANVAGSVLVGLLAAAAGYYLVSGT
jgi:CrcB protein